jgi:sterile alpha motif and leucine zipper-containing kinase AZK
LHSFIREHDLYDEYGFNLILNWAHDIALGMNYLHSEAPIKIIHRDLKSNNVLITGEDMSCKICDFGSSRFGIQTTKMTITGTFPWMSPEIIQSKPANQSCDIWSFGVVLWELITGEIPFKGIEEFQIAFLVVEKDYRLPIPNGCPPVFSSLMQMCWQTDPKLRPTFKQILSILDEIDLDDTAKAEIDNLFTKNKSKWEVEIEQAFERLKKIEDDLQIKEKLLEAKERRLREIEMEYITQTSKLIHLEDHDVNTWREIDVYEWIKKIGQKNNRDGIADYCENFLKHNINGKRLLLMSKADLRNIGITSEGHIIDLHVIK